MGTEKGGELCEKSQMGRAESDRGWLGSGAGQPVCGLAALCFLERRLSKGAEALLGCGLVQVEAGLRAWGPEKSFLGPGVELSPER